MTKHVTEKNKTPFYIRVSFDGLREKYYYFKDIETLKIAKEHIDTLLRCYYLRTRAHKDAIEASKWAPSDGSKMVVVYAFNTTIEEYDYYKPLHLFLLSHIRFTQKVFEKEGNQILKLHLINANIRPHAGGPFERIFKTGDILFFLPRKGDLNAFIERVVSFAKERYNITLSDISLGTDDYSWFEYTLKDYAGIYAIEGYKHVSFINNLYCEIYPQFKRGKPLPPITSNIELML